MSPAMQGVILSSFFWTYAALQVPGGWVIDRAGPSRVITGATLGWGIFQTLAMFATSGVFLLLTRWGRLGRFLLVVSMLMLALCGFSPLGNLVMYPLETRFPPWDSSHGAPDGIVVLTHAWWTSAGPADDPVAEDMAALHASRARILAVADEIIPGHGARFRPSETTPN